MNEENRQRNKEISRAAMFRWIEEHVEYDAMGFFSIDIEATPRMSFSEAIKKAMEEE